MIQIICKYAEKLTFSHVEKYLEKFLSNQIQILHNPCQQAWLGWNMKIRQKWQTVFRCPFLLSWQEITFKTSSYKSLRINFYITLLFEHFLSFFIKLSFHTVFSGFRQPSAFISPSLLPTYSGSLGLGCQAMLMSWGGVDWSECQDLDLNWFEIKD